MYILNTELATSSHAIKIFVYNMFYNGCIEFDGPSEF